MRSRPLALFILCSILAFSGSASADSETESQKAPKELISPELSPLDAFRRDLASLREALLEDMTQLQAAAKAAAPKERSANANAVRERKQRYELDLLRLQLKLSVARGQSEKTSSIAATLERLEALYAQDGGKQ